MSALTVSLLGPPRVTHADGSPVAFRSRKELALFAYLAVEAGMAHSRDTLIGLLWADTSLDAARNSLRVAIANLRHTLGKDASALLHADRHTVQLNGGNQIVCDVVSFTDHLIAARTHQHITPTGCDVCYNRLQEAAGLYRGDFLAGLSLPDSEAWEEWVIVRREGLHIQALELLTMLGMLHDQRQDYTALCRDARRQLELEPWREPAHRQLMRGLALSGDRAAALTQYSTCCQVLARELGIEPDAETP